MNNEPRYQGNKFFTGNAAEASKEYLLDFIKIPVKERDLIVPLNSYDHQTI